jgi:hypothetical protein
MPLPMPDQQRIDKTTAKTRLGGLPAATEHEKQVSVGDGRPCDGCGETIYSTEMLSTVTIVVGLQWRFHAVCYEAWAKFAC